MAQKMFEKMFEKFDQIVLPFFNQINTVMSEIIDTQISTCKMPLERIQLKD